jgi:quercetin dioxygenase-like cupin family protein
MVQEKKIKIIQSSYLNQSMSVIEMDILPKTGNPKHFHTLFSETFEILEGELFVGIENKTMTLKKGEKATIQIGQNHFFKNKTDNCCKIRVTLDPSNANFEDAMLIYYGLLAEGLCSKAGTPKKIVDLAIFIYLNNSKMSGMGRIIENTFRFIATRAIKKGRLNELKERYCSNRNSSL